MTDQPIEQTQSPVDPAPDAPSLEDVSTEAVPEATVRQLRDELAKRRVRSREQTASANARLAAAYAATDGRLVEPELIEVTDELLDADGLIDAAKVTAAIDALIDAKPYLASRKPSAPIVQGVQLQAPDTQGLFSMIRDRF